LLSVVAFKADCEGEDAQLRAAFARAHPSPKARAILRDTSTPYAPHLIFEKLGDRAEWLWAEVVMSDPTPVNVPGLRTKHDIIDNDKTSRKVSALVALTSRVRGLGLG